MRTRTPAILALSLLTVALAACNRDKGYEDTSTTAPPAEVIAPMPADPAPVARPEPATYTVDRFAIAGEGDQAYLTDSRGRRLYVLDGDKDGTKCVGDCLDTWRAAVGPIPVSDLPDVPADSIGTMTRPDGMTQVTYYGQPLYYFDDGTPQLPDVTVTADESPWGRWYLVRPNGETIVLKEGVPTTDSPTAAGADARDLPTQSPGGQPRDQD